MLAFPSLCSVELCCVYVVLHTIRSRLAAAAAAAAAPSHTVRLVFASPPRPLLLSVSCAQPRSTDVELRGLIGLWYDAEAGGVGAGSATAYDSGDDFTAPAVDAATAAERSACITRLAKALRDTVPSNAGLFSGVARRA